MLQGLHGLTDGWGDEHGIQIDEITHLTAWILNAGIGFKYLFNEWSDKVLVGENF
ncbi:hypothetical protein M2375_003860 [Comamonas sp. BIGb0152]|uniref:hypothetical protein n=1 Tax=Comamonas sp. BIGb0152 TaxID=2940601 RepID=UPI0021691DB6|nr:hypothetical protein [Comamonas sp. BIGb0152]MCS4295613.1 hypothetical protein [Comamonas sp. BIGb0152]